MRLESHTFGSSVEELAEAVAVEEGTAGVVESTAAVVEGTAAVVKGTAAAVEGTAAAVGGTAVAVKGTVAAVDSDLWEDNLYDKGRGDEPFDTEDNDDCILWPNVLSRGT